MIVKHLHPDVKSRDGLLVVSMSKKEIAIGTQTGIYRQAFANIDGKEDKYSNKPRDFHEAVFDHVMGAWGEIVAAKVLLLPFDPHTDHWGKPDLLPNVHVRTRGQVRDREMIVRPDAPDDDPYVLVKCNFDDHRDSHPFHVFGWTFARDAKRPEWLRPRTRLDNDGTRMADEGDRLSGHRPAYFVPPSVLRPIGELTDMLEVWRRTGELPAPPAVAPEIR